jgi:hypothetical protein
LRKGVGKSSEIRWRGATEHKATACGLKEGRQSFAIRPLAKVGSGGKDRSVGAIGGQGVQQANEPGRWMLSMIA